MDAQREMAEFLHARAGVPITPTLRCIGRRAGDQLVAVIGYDNYTGVDGSIEIHIASIGDYAGTKNLLKAAFHYPFEVCGCKVLIASTSSDNTDALQLAISVGFKPVAEIPDGVPGGSLHILTMRREDCLWLEENYDRRRALELRQAAKEMTNGKH